MALGFDGLMLDTIDTPTYLETRIRRASRARARRCAISCARSATRFPKLLLVANGTTALAEAAPYVDGFVVEGMFATYDFGRRIYRATTPDEQAWKLAQIDRALAIARRPVFTIEYADIGDVALARDAHEPSSASRGFHPYVAIKELNTLP